MRKVIDYSRLKDMKASAIYKADLVMFDKQEARRDSEGNRRRTGEGGTPPLL